MALNPSAAIFLSPSSKTRELSPLRRSHATFERLFKPQNDARVKHGPNDSIFAQEDPVILLPHTFDSSLARSGYLNTKIYEGPLDLFYTGMNTPESYGKGSVRWRYISDGYTKYWYLRSALRWLSIVSSVTALIIFGITWHTYADYKHLHTLYLGTILFIVAVSNLDPPSTIVGCLLSATATSVFRYQRNRSCASLSPSKKVFR